MTENHSAKARAEGKIITVKHGTDTACYHPNGCVIMIFDDRPKQPDFSSITREVSNTPS